MSANDGDFYSFSNMSEEEFMDMLNYDPATDACALLWSVMHGVMAKELAGLALAGKEKNPI